MEGTGLTLGEAMALTNKDNDGFGNGSWFMWIIALAIIFGNGGGFFGGAGRQGGFVDGTLTRDAVNSGLQYNQLDNGIRGVQSGLCDGFYAVNNSVKDAVSALKDCCLSCVAA